MSWRDDIRPASFRGVPFHALGHTLSGGRRGAHREYPGRDEGDVLDLGLSDKRVSLTAYVIGDDVAARRTALVAALDEKGPGELVHPWLGPMQVVLDPDSDWSAQQIFGRGREAGFRISFLRTGDRARFPVVRRGRDAAVRASADIVTGLAASAGSAAMDLSGPSPVAEAARTGMIAALDDVEAVRPLAGASDRSSGAGFRRTALARVAAHDAKAALDALVGLVGDVLTVIAAGDRKLRAPAQVGAACDALLASPPDTAQGGTGALARRIAGNAGAIRSAIRLPALGYAARAAVLRDYDSHEAAFETLRGLDAAIETAIRAEARPGGDGALVRALTDLRAETRETMLASAADLVPVAVVDPGVSLPSLALAHRVSGGIALQPDLVARNRVAHPLWCPPDSVTVKVERENA